jgi:hypothetical protein
MYEYVVSYYLENCVLPKSKWLLEELIAAEANVV